MNLTVILTDASTFRVHKLGCIDAAKDLKAQRHGDTQAVEAATQNEVIDALWGDVIGNYDGAEADRVRRGCRAETVFVGCTKGLSQP